MDMVTNEAGQIALVFYQPIPKALTIPGKPKPKEYITTVQHGVSLLWADPKDVDKILATKVYCCGGRANTAFRYASQPAVNVWRFGHY